MDADTESSSAPAPPVAFLCHASEDKELVRRLASDLLGHGVDVFFDEWELGPGDSLRQRIDAGLGRCTHFIAVLTANSLAKPWVNAEIDAAFVRRVDGRVRFIPLRVGLAVTALPPLLAGIIAPSLDDYAKDLAALVSFLHGVSRKPALGAAPGAVAERKAAAEMSAAAEALVRLMVETSSSGIGGDPQLSPAEMRKLTGLLDDDVADAIDELEAQGLVAPVRAVTGAGSLAVQLVVPQSSLFVRFDARFAPWNPEEDAQRIAAAIARGVDAAVSLDEIAASFAWTARRMNPAVGYLIENELVLAGEARAPGGRFVVPWISATRATRRFLKDRA